LFLITFIGVTAAYKSTKFSDYYSHNLIAAMASGFGVFILLRPILIISQIIKTCIIICAIFFAAYNCHLAKRYIKAIGTAFIGSFLLMHGISIYAGGLPSLINIEITESTKNTSVTNQMIGYVFAMIFCTGIGGFIQL
jgi:hypothetical protein